MALRRHALNDNRHPISGEKKRRESIQQFARRNGWDAQGGAYVAGDYRFNKDEREFFVAFYRNWPLGGVVYESERQGGKPVHSDSINDVLAGLRCTCTEDKDHYYEWIVSPDCKVRHR